MRFVIAQPVDTAEGTPFYEVNDSLNQRNMAQIHKSVPGAPDLATMIQQLLENK